MTPDQNCARCFAPLPAGSTPRRQFCSDACRKAAQRAATPPPLPTDGPVTAAVRLALAENDGMDGIDAARVQLAIAAARMVDGGSVPAMKELRGVLADLAGLVTDDEHRAFLAAVATPRCSDPDVGRA